MEAESVPRLTKIHISRSPRYRDKVPAQDGLRQQLGKLLLSCCNASSSVDVGDVVTVSLRSVPGSLAFVSQLHAHVSRNMFEPSPCELHLPGLPVGVEHVQAGRSLGCVVQLCGVPGLDTQSP